MYIISVKNNYKENYQIWLTSTNMYKLYNNLILTLLALLIEGLEKIIVI